MFLETIFNISGSLQPQTRKNQKIQNFIEKIFFHRNQIRASRPHPEEKSYIPSPNLHFQKTTKNLENPEKSDFSEKHDQGI